jgi:hypothetical protein
MNKKIEPASCLLPYFGGGKREAMKEGGGR